MRITNYIRFLVEEENKTHSEITAILFSRGYNMDQGSFKNFLVWTHIC